jgi:hypothetical protein
MIRLQQTLVLALTLVLAVGCAARRPPAPPPPPVPQPVAVYPPPPPGAFPPGSLPPGAVTQPPAGAMVLPPPPGRPGASQPFPTGPQTLPAPAFPTAPPQPGASLPAPTPPVSTTPQGVAGTSLEGVGYRWQPNVPPPPLANRAPGATPYSPQSPAPTQAPNPASTYGPSAPYQPPTTNEAPRASVFLLPPTGDAAKDAPKETPRETGEPPLNSPKIALYPPTDTAPPAPYVPPTSAAPSPPTTAPSSPSATLSPPTVAPSPPAAAPSPPTAAPSAPRASSFPVGIANYDRVRPEGNVTTGSRPSLEGLDWLKKEGISTVVFVHLPGVNVESDREVVTRRGMTFIELEFDPKNLDKKSVDEFLRVQRDASLGKIFVYDDVDAAVTGALWYLSFRTIDQANDEEARVRAGSLGLRENRDGTCRDMWNAVRTYLDR